MCVFVSFRECASVCVSVRQALTHLVCTRGKAFKTRGSHVTWRHAAGVLGEGRSSMKRDAKGETLS